MVASVAKNQKSRVLNFSRANPYAQSADESGTEIQLHRTTISVFFR